MPQAGGQEQCGERGVPCEPVVGVQLIQRIDRLAGSSSAAFVIAASSIPTNAKVPAARMAPPNDGPVPRVTTPVFESALESGPKKISRNP